MAETTERKKPTFLRNDWHKKIKLGKGVKKNQKWRAAKGRHNKIRLSRKGHPTRPKIGWGTTQASKGLINDMKPVYVSNITELEQVPKNSAILITSVGKKKRQMILTKATELKLTILNKYKEKQHATS